ncbi:MAG: PIN domain-containing protein, partial [Spirochaetota bacterium]
EQRKNGSNPVILVSKDTAVRIKAESLGLKVEDYKNDKTSLFRALSSLFCKFSSGLYSQRFS